MNDFRLSVLKPRYEELFSTCLLRSSWLDKISSIAGAIVSQRGQYDAVEAQTTVPWWFVGILHYRDLNFQDAPPINGVSYPFADIASNAVRQKKFDVAKDRSIAAWLWRFEGWNGFNYANMGINSEYLWNGTNQFGSGNNRGMFLANGQFDPTAKSDQAGAAALVWYMHHQGIIPADNQQLSQTASQSNGGWNLSVDTTGGGSGAFNAIQMVDAFRYYQKLPHQDQAINWLQQQLSGEVLFEFARQWRVNPNPTVTPTPPPVAPAVVANTVSATSAPAPAPAPTSTALPPTVKLKVPYLSQLDNYNNPTGSCNVTSASMCMAYFGHSIRNSQGQQLEDELYQYCENNGLSRHSPHDIAKLIRAFGYKDDFQENAKWDDVKKWLAAGKPCIVHGYFTNFGHIVVIIGYNEKGWLINDPYGEWFSTGYDTSKNGAGLVYSYSMMQEKCSPDGSLWIHYVSK